MHRFLCVLFVAIACQTANSQQATAPATSSIFEVRTYREGEKQLAYRLLKPRGYDAAKSWPLIVWLHGSGEKGNNNSAQLVQISKTFLADPARCPALVMVPQCPADSSWLAVGLNEPPAITEPARLIVATLVDLQKEFKIDDRRIYIGGFSMGGCGTWELLSRYPQLFAAAFPIAGPPGDRPGLAPLHKDVPIWVFHGDRDNIAPVDSSRTIVAALKAVDSPVKYTEYRNGGHEAHQALADPALQEWLFAQRRADRPTFTPSKVLAAASLITKTLAAGTHATWTGKVERTRHNIPRLLIDEVRYSLKPAPQAPTAVLERLAQIGKGEAKGEHTVTGTIFLDERPWVVVEKIIAVSE
jgi:poly(3-hydroxybutyrate) depolymerase